MWAAQGNWVHSPTVPWGQQHQQTGLSASDVLHAQKWWQWVRTSLHGLNFPKQPIREKRRFLEKWHSATIKKKVNLRFVTANCYSYWQQRCVVSLRPVAMCWTPDRTRITSPRRPFVIPRRTFLKKGATWCLSVIVSINKNMIWVIFFQPCCLAKPHPPCNKHNVLLNPREE